MWKSNNIDLEAAAQAGSRNISTVTILHYDKVTLKAVILTKLKSLELHSSFYISRTDFDQAHLDYF